MAKKHTISADLRDDQGKGASRRLRRAGLIPGVLYGAGRPARSIQLKHNEVLHASRSEGFFSSIVELDFNGKRQPVLVRDWQVHPYRQQMLHMDFMRVREDEAIRVNVPLHLLNRDESPAGKVATVMIYQNLTEVEIECLPGDLPEAIEIDLIDLKEGDAVYLSEIKLPKGVQIVALMHDEQDEMVVSAHTVKAVEEEPVAGDAADSTQSDGAAKADEDKPADDKD